MKYHYDIQSDIRYYGLIPKDVRSEGGQITGSVPLIQVGAGMQSVSEKPFDYRRWKEPPHVVLANLRLDDLGAVTKFTREYGYVAGKARDNRYQVDLERLAEQQERVRDAWIGFGHENDLAIELMLPSDHLSLHIAANGGEIAVNHLWTLIQILLLRDIAEERTELCASPDCPARYFLPARKGQKFCSHRCSVLVSVRRLRARQKKAMKLLEAAERKVQRKEAKR
jgi:hypothetical protein